MGISQKFHKNYQNSTFKEQSSAKIGSGEVSCAKVEGLPSKIFPGASPQTPHIDALPDTLPLATPLQRIFEGKSTTHFAPGSRIFEIAS